MENSQQSDYRGSHATVSGHIADRVRKGHRQRLVRTLPATPQCVIVFDRGAGDARCRRRSHRRPCLFPAEVVVAVAAVVVVMVAVVPTVVVLLLLLRMAVGHMLIDLQVECLNAARVISCCLYARLLLTVIVTGKTTATVTQFTVADVTSVSNRAGALSGVPLNGQDDTRTPGVVFVAMNVVIS